MSTILYAVIALTSAEAAEVSNSLRQQPQMKGIVDWFDANRGALYGAAGDDWKPFGGKTLDEMLNEGKGGKRFHSQTNLVEGLDEEFSDLASLVSAGIEVYFIDVFALFLTRYQDLARRLDVAFAQDESCCFVLPYGLSSDSEALLSMCSKLWPTVFSFYSNRGALHRVAVRAAELKNVRSYRLKYASGDRPNPALLSQINQKFGTDNPTTPPRIGAA